MCNILFRKFWKHWHNDRKRSCVSRVHRMKPTPSEFWPPIRYTVTSSWLTSPERYVCGFLRETCLLEYIYGSDGTVLRSWTRIESHLSIQAAVYFLKNLFYWTIQCTELSNVQCTDDDNRSYRNVCNMLFVSNAVYRFAQTREPCSLC